MSVLWTFAVGHAAIVRGMRQTDPEILDRPPQLMFETVIFFMTATKAFEYRSSEYRNPILYILYRDQFAYYIVRPVSYRTLESTR